MTGAADLALAGLGIGDVASASHPYLQLAALGREAVERRARTARLTPGGLPQPPEVMGVDADARVPNALQPMSGEFELGREVGDGRPAYFGASMPAPTGVSNGQMDGTWVHPYGAPTGMAELAALPAALRPTGSDRFALAALPHFAAGGVLGAGQTGVVGEDGPEVVDTLPGGGA